MFKGETFVEQLRSDQRLLRQLDLPMDTLQEQLDLVRSARIDSYTISVRYTMNDGTVLTGQVVKGMQLGDGALEIPILSFIYDEIGLSPHDPVTDSNRTALNLSETANEHEAYKALGLVYGSDHRDFDLSFAGDSSEYCLQIRRNEFSGHNKYSNVERWRWPQNLPQFSERDFFELSMVSLLHDFNRDFAGILHVEASPV